MMFPENPTIGLLGFIFLISGLTLIITGSGIAKISFHNLHINKSVKTWISGIIILLLGFLLFFIGNLKTIKQLSFQSKIEGIPLKIFKIYNFDNDGEINKWEAFPIENKPHITIASESKFAYSGKNSLRLKVNIKAHEINQKTEYGGIGISNANLQDIKAVSAWIFLPHSEQVENIKIKSHIMCYYYDKKQTNNAIGFIGEDITLKPGKWVPLFIGTFENSDTKPEFNWKGKINELYITIWSNRNYNGSIYFDDITIYKNISE